MRPIEFFRNLSIRCKLLLSYFCLFSLALIVGSEIIYNRVREALAGGLTAGEIAAMPAIQASCQTMPLK